MLLQSNVIWDELTSGMPNTGNLIRVLLRLAVASLLGALIGVQRQRAGKPAGLRTHMLVTLGTTVFILSGLSATIGADGVSRVIQGVATGIGFIGAGSILKLSEERNVQGLTTAASVWASAAVGVAAGVGSIGIALLSTLFTLGVLSFAKRFEHSGGAKPPTKGE